MPDYSCACDASDAYECWAVRYDIEDTEVEEDGGPCLCVCHDDRDDEETR